MTGNLAIQDQRIHALAIKKKISANSSISGLAQKAKGPLKALRKVLCNSSRRRKSLSMVKFSLFLLIFFFVG